MPLPLTASGGLSVELSSEPYGAAPGTRVEHVVRIRNSGLVDATASPVEVTAPLTDAVASPGCAAIPGGFRCEVGVVPGGGTVEVTISGVVAAPADGFVRNTATSGGSDSFNGYLVETASAPPTVRTAATAAVSHAVTPPWEQGLTLLLTGVLVAVYWRARRRERLGA
ncbi:hypothetical protein Afil01_25660 [Actinorhabdospora filicis]|uniref:DUF11 domain-containing protein n=1 Tax=Actinorhabdospora filicis TaxID=1785913 RepID=A0A9W6SIL6_9ACTN|nr:hypothetical protein [Actinorhabdospora filicis]GLZ77759.1 hypothetical protein Afil01_25660 [Actinorhabdospora filicis]